MRDDTDAGHEPASGIILPADRAEFFDEEHYLAANPDIVKGISDGHFVDGYHHYVMHGRQEGREAAPAFAEAWYLCAYPMARHDIDQGRARDARDHYQRLGRFRGYLPNPAAPRPDDPSRLRSRFGGLWTDAPDALDTIAGRLSIGRLSEPDAALLADWTQQGFVILPDAVPATTLETARADLDRAFQGGYPPLLFQCPSRGTPDIPWCPEFEREPATALDPHWYSDAIRDAMFTPAITNCLELLFDRKPLVAQSLGFLRGTDQPVRQDSAHAGFSQQRRFVTAWIALDDVTEGNGAPFCYPGSHRFPDFLPAGGYKSLTEAIRMDAADAPSLREAEYRHHETLLRTAATRTITEHHLRAKAGDVMIRHADLAHADRQPPQDTTRRSLLAYYCPADIAPLTFETGRIALRRHGDGGFYGTAIY